MKVESIPVAGKGQALPPAPAEAERSRQEPARLPEPPRDENKIAPEEILDRIKSLTEDGLYSVRFEKSEEFDRVIIKLVESETGELIRQIPPEELLGTAKFLREFRGNMIDTET